MQERQPVPTECGPVASPCRAGRLPVRSFRMDSRPQAKATRFWRVPAGYGRTAGVSTARPAARDIRNSSMAMYSGAP